MKKILFVCATFCTITGICSCEPKEVGWPPKHFPKAEDSISIDSTMVSEPKEVNS